MDCLRIVADIVELCGLYIQYGWMERSGGLYSRELSCDFCLCMWSDFVYVFDELIEIKVFKRRNEKIYTRPSPGPNGTDNSFPSQILSSGGMVASSPSKHRTIPTNIRRHFTQHHQSYSMHLNPSQDGKAGRQFRNN